MTDRDTGGMPTRLARINPVAAFVATLLVVLAGMVVPGFIGGALLLALAVGLGAVTATTWPVQTPVTRTLRLLMLTALAAVALSKIL